MDETFNYPKFKLRMVCDDDGEPKVLVISSDKISLDKDTVRDIATGTVGAMDAKNGQMQVFTKQKNGSFDQQQMEIFTANWHPAAKENGELKKDISLGDIESHIAPIRGIQEAAAAQTAEQIRQQYKQEQEQGIE